MKPLSGIYQITFPTGAIYIGKTNDYYRRVDEHINKLLKGTAAKALQAEILKTKGESELSISLIVECHEDHIDLMEDIYIRRAKQEYGSRCLNTQQRKDLGSWTTTILEDNLHYLNLSTAEHLNLLNTQDLENTKLKQRIELLESTEALCIEIAELQMDNADLQESLREVKKQLSLEKNKTWWQKLWE